MSMRKRVTTASSGLLLARLAASVVLLTAGCRTTRPPAASDDTFFAPFTAVPKPAEVKPSAPAVSDARPQEPGKVDSLLGNQQEQERRIRSLAVLLERLESSRRGTRSDTAKPAPRTQQPVVAPKPVAAPPENKDIKDISEAEKLFASQDYRKTIQWCQDVFDRGVGKGIEDRCYFLMGASHYRLKQFDLALVSLKKVLEIKGSSKRADASFIMGLTYRQLGMRQRAATLFEAALHEAPDDNLARSIRQELDRLAKNR